jgi:hypothetical protein
MIGKVIFRNQKAKIRINVKSYGDRTSNSCLNVWSKVRGVFSQWLPQQWSILPFLCSSSNTLSVIHVYKAYRQEILHMRERTIVVKEPYACLKLITTFPYTNDKWAWSIFRVHEHKLETGLLLCPPSNAHSGPWFVICITFCFHDSWHNCYLLPFGVFIYTRTEIGSSTLHIFTKSTGIPSSPVTSRHGGSYCIPTIIDFLYSIPYYWRIPFFWSAEASSHLTTGDSSQLTIGARQACIYVGVKGKVRRGTKHKLWFVNTNVGIIFLFSCPPTGTCPFTPFTLWSHLPRLEFRIQQLTVFWIPLYVICSTT